MPIEVIATTIPVTDRSKQLALETAAAIAGTISNPGLRHIPRLSIGQTEDPFLKKTLTHGQQAMVLFNIRDCGSLRNMGWIVDGEGSKSFYTADVFPYEMSYTQPLATMDCIQISPESRESVLTLISYRWRIQNTALTVPNALQYPDDSIIKMLEGVIGLLDNFSQKNRRRGWAYLPDVTHTQGKSRS